MKNEHQDLLDQLLRRRLARFPDAVPQKEASIQPAVPRIRIDQATPVSFDEKHEHPNPGFNCNRTLGHSLTIGGIKFWCEGTTVLCQCPECAAPMTARTWIGLADCWRCQTSIELSEAQQQALRELTKAAPATRPLPTVAPPTPKTGVEVAPIIVDFDSEPEDEQELELERLTRSSLVATLVRRGFHMTPAWLLSFLLHLIAILILAIIVLGGDERISETISLSTFLDRDRSTGGEVRIENPDDDLQDDLPLPSDMEISDRELRAIAKNAARDARELIEDPLPTAPLPDLDAIRKNLATRTDTSMTFASRDPRVRSEIVKREGGTTLTEAAVARGLRWLASVQNQDGSWSLKRYESSREPDNRGDAMGTSLALLPFLGAGQTHEFGRYKQNVAKGLTWLIKNQLPNGDLRAGYRQQAGIYAHGQATIVLCEALAMTGDEQFREPAQRAIRFIENWQHKAGGWRYDPKSPGDTSVLGWQLMALQSARAPNSGLAVDSSTLKLADYFLDSVATRRRSELGRMPVGTLYSYLPRREATAPMTAEAMLCRMYLGWEKEDPRLRAAVKWLAENHLPSTDDGELDFYFWYYATQVMHHYGGQPWKVWNDETSAILVATQERKGRHPGSWDPDDVRWGESGRIFSTALAVCTLEVYYRHLPIFQKPKEQGTD